VAACFAALCDDDVGAGAAGFVNVFWVADHVAARVGVSCTVFEEKFLCSLGIDDAYDVGLNDYAKVF
jgi:hypothetical protein